MAGVIIGELRLKGIGKKDASIRFKKGANIVSGPSNTGKTFVFECIEYMLGKSTFERRIKESRDYQDIYLELEDELGYPFTIKSDFEGGDFKKFECSINDIFKDTEYEVLKRQHTPGKENTLSSCILKKCNLSGALVRTNANGKTRELSLRDLRMLHLVDELRVPTKGSPFLTGQYTSSTAEENVLKLLITGVDDSHIIESIPDKVLANKAGRLEVLNELIGLEKYKLLDKPSKEEILSQEDKLNDSICKTRYQRDEVVNVFSDLDSDKKRLMLEIHQTTIRKEELSKLYENTYVLEKQYISDISRLKSTIEVGSALVSFGDVNCPLCDSLIDSNTNESVFDVFVSAQSELTKMDGLLLELSKAKSLFEEELVELSLIDESNNADLNRLNSKLDTDIKVEIENLSSSVDVMQKKLQEVALTISDYESLEYLSSQKEEVDKIIESAPPKKRVFDKVTSGAMEEISLNMECFLKQWGYPSISRVVYSEKAKDFVLSGENRNLAGKGYRAITFSSFVLSLVNYSLNRDKKLGFCVIDSPLVTYKKPDVPDGEGISEDMASNFYESLADVDENSQVIIVENEDVPVDIEDRVNHIHFTKNLKLGRYGFIPFDMSI